MPDPSASYASLHGWDRDFLTWPDRDLPSYVGRPTYCKRDYLADRAALAARAPGVAIVGAPFDDAVSHRPGARFGPRAIRQATHTEGDHSIQLGVDPRRHLDVVDAGDANRVPAWLERSHALIYRKVRDVAASGAVPIVLGGDHSITWPSATAVAEAVAPLQHPHRPFRRPCRQRP